MVQRVPSACDNPVMCGRFVQVEKPEFYAEHFGAEFVRTETLPVLDGLEEGDLDTKSKNCPAEFEPMFGTYRRIFQFACDHWYMHRAQAAIIKRVAGLIQD